MWPNAAGKLMVICGARTLEDLPFSQTLQKYTQAEFRRELAFSRAIFGDRQYVQDRLRLYAPEICGFSPKSHMYICGLKGLEEGVDEALIDIARTHQLACIQIRNARGRPLSRCTDHIRTPYKYCA
jgi:benzoyl-CoA 2,3-epoxidase subunit A